MKICVTGVNPVQCGHIPRLKYISFVKAIVKALGMEGKHDVTLRKVIPGDSLDAYDRVVVFLAPMRGFVCRNTLGALWAISQSHGKLTLSFDDWQVREALHSIRSLRADWDKIINENPFNYEGIVQSVPHRQLLKETLDSLCGESWSYKSLVPCYKGGDLSKLSLPNSNIMVCNPAPLFKGVYGWVDEQDIYALRKECWVLAALHDHRSWLKKQNAKWEVAQFGHRSQGQPRLEEPQIFEQYKQSFGAMSPAYKICGSGWWRARYGFAADAMTVIVGAKEEMSMMPDPEAYAFSVEQVEQMTNEKIRDIAIRQRLSYYGACSAAEAVDDITRAIV